MRFRSLFVTWVVFGLFLSGSSAFGASPPKIGSPAPEFSFVDDAGLLRSSSDFFSADSKKPGSGVVIAWFPKAFTPGWTAELAALRDSASQLAEYDVEIFYVSLDSPEKNAEFAAAMKATLPVLSDPDGATAKRYGVIGFGGLYSKRWTFYIDASGILREIDQDVHPETAGQDVADKLEELGFPQRVTKSPAHDSTGVANNAQGTEADGS